MTTKIASLAAICLALLAGPILAAEGDDLESSQIRIDKQVVTVYTHRGQSYRYTDPEGLADAALAGQLVCVEGKLRDVRGTDFTLFGTDQKLQLAAADALKGFSPGDNVWIGGHVQDGVFKAQVAVKLKSDLALFDDRFAAASKAKAWDRMLDLASWISRSATYNPKIAFEEHRRYRASRDRAVTSACALAEAAFKDNDAAGYSRLATRLLDLEVDRELVWRYFRLAAAIDPDQDLAARRLAEAGFIRWHGLWLTREQKAEREADETRRLTKIHEMEAARQQRRTEEAVSGAALTARESAELETSLTALPPADAAARLASTLERTSSPRLGRRVLFLTAALPPQQQTQPLAAALRSREPEIRCAALELAASRNDSAARKLILAALSDDSDEVVDLACSLLASAGDTQALGALVGLTASDKDFRARAAVDVLRGTTNQDRWTPVEWRLWWNKNKAAYPAPPAQ